MNVPASPHNQPVEDRHTDTGTSARALNGPHSEPRHGNTPPRKAWSSGLYLITPDERDTARLIARVDAVIDSAALLQYRNKTASPALRLAQAAALRTLCTARGRVLIINDDVALARDIGADGVHLGVDDGDVEAARACLGDEALVGVSCYDDLERARQAAALGASYMAFGAFFPSPTKPLARRASFGLLSTSGAFNVPRVAIGGITQDNARSLVAAGADLIAVISGVFDAPDPVAAARAYAACFDQASLDQAGSDRG